jgi:cytochrome P450
MSRQGRDELREGLPGVAAGANNSGIACGAGAWYEGAMDAVRGLAEAPFFDWFDPAVQADPEPIVNELRARTAVVRTPLGTSVLRRREVQAMLADPRLVTAVPHLVRVQSGGDGPLAGMLGDTVIAMDGPDHTRLRRLVARSFTPRAADRHRAVMRSLVDELVDEFAGDGHCEFMADFADRYPVQVICEVLGVPRDDHPRFAQWGETLTYLLSLELSARLADVEQAASELGAYVDELVEDRQANPRDDMVTSLVEASEDNDRLSQGELRAMIAGLLFAGYDTTRNQLGRAMITFCHHPDQWDRLAAEPDLAPRSVDEVMRLAGAVVGIPRIATEDLEVSGWSIPAGTLVFLSTASANRDESVYDDAGTFDITAERVPHLTFGGGPHYCLGANLARAEIEEALRVLPGRLRNIQLDGQPSWRQGTGISGPSHLPLRFQPAR